MITIDSMLRMQLDMGFLTQGIKDLGELQSRMDLSDPNNAEFFQKVQQFTEARFQFQDFLREQFQQRGFSQADMSACLG